MAPDPIRVAILGVAGYAGETAARILLGHPHVRLVHVGSDRLVGERLDQVVPSLLGSTDLRLAADTPEVIRASGAEVVLLAKKSPEVTKVVPALLAAGLKLIDIGAEFRLRDPGAYQRWYGEVHGCPQLLAEAVYGLSEVHTDAIRRARLVGNPGCHASAILLPLLPLLAQGLLERSQPIVAVSYSGLSGAGKRFVEGNNNLFWAINENLHAYKTLTHQHTGEVDQEAVRAAGGPCHVSIVPHLAPITRGILATISATLAPGVDQARVLAAWQQAYAGRPFVRVRDRLAQVEVSHVVGTNACDIAAQAEGRLLVLTSALDNLVKGASGQAVQNLNLMHGLPEDAGLTHRSV